MARLTMYSGSVLGPCRSACSPRREPWGSRALRSRPVGGLRVHYVTLMVSSWLIDESLRVSLMFPGYLPSGWHCS
eukprot:7841980-Alexandrium_andersonii.AAC.1